MSLSVSMIDRCRLQDLHAILARKKLNLILDLDNTLLNSKKTRNLTLDDKQHVINNPRELYKVEDGSRLVKLRPGAREFLKKAREMFELSIYTMGTRDYAHRMANLLALGSGLHYWSMFGKIISKEDCTTMGKKGLDVVLSDKRVVLIVDDREDVWEGSCKSNLVKIEPFWFFREGKVEKKVNDDSALGHDEMDGGLQRVLRILTSVHSMFYDDNCGDRDYMKRDVRRVLEIVGDDENEKTKEDGEKVVLGKRLRETNARRFIERFCAPLNNKKFKKTTSTATNSPCLV
ncbi:hypothetical protein RND81_04G027700 [Saponaria officinalis]|uniref:protein-serine/threonine phosphatase n=1 Tax=Saponaria officinalis TaxID=3572 RepID=A0AAW1LIA9_SAPOF